MKKLVLAASVAALLLASCNKTKNATETAKDQSTEAVATSSAVAYINLDSLVNKYDMYTDLRATFEEKAKKADSEVTSKGRSLERDLKDYQEKVQKGLVTRAQAQAIEETLTQKQQAFVQNRDRVLAEITEEEQVMLNQIQYSITEYLKEFNSDFRYSMIISTNGNGPILNADPSIDITNLVLEGLNKKHAETKTSKAPEAKK